MNFQKCASINLFLYGNRIKGKMSNKYLSINLVILHLIFFTLPLFKYPSVELVLTLNSNSKVPDRLKC